MKKAATLAILCLLLAAIRGTAINAQQSNELQMEFERSLRLVGRGLADRGQGWRCEPGARFVCSREGCQALEYRVWVNLDFPGRRYERCDSKGCDGYEMTYSVGGIFTTVTLTGHPGTFLKSVNDGSEYLEVATLGTAAYASFGRCTSP